MFSKWAKCPQSLQSGSTGTKSWASEQGLSGLSSVSAVHPMMQSVPGKAKCTKNPGKGILMQATADKGSTGPQPRLPQSLKYVVPAYYLTGCHAFFYVHYGKGFLG